MPISQLSSRARLSPTIRSLPIRTYAASPLSGTPPKIPVTVITPADPVIVQKRVVPVAVPVAPLPPSGSPPPPPGRGGKKSHGFRNFLLWSGFLGGSAYSIATYIALHNDDFEQFYTQYVPGGLRLVEYAEEKGWDQVGASEVVGGVNRAYDSSKSLYNRITGQITPSTPISEQAADRVTALQKKVESKSSDLRSKASETISSLTHKASSTASSAVPADSENPKALGDDARAVHFDAVDDSKLRVLDAKDQAVDKTKDIKEEAVRRANEIKEKTARKGSSLKEKVVGEAQHIKQEVVDKSAQAQKDLASRTSHVQEATHQKATEAQDLASKKSAEAQKAISQKTTEAQIKAAEIQNKAGELQDDVSAKAHQLSDKALGFVEQLKAKVEEKFDAVVEEGGKAKEAVVESAHQASNQLDAIDLKGEALKKIEQLKAQGGAVADKAKDAVDAVSEQAAHLVGESKEAIGQAEKKVETKTGQWSEGVENLVHQAEDALKGVKTEVENKIAEKDMVDGKLPWVEALPIGFEAPPGYYIPKAVKATSPKAPSSSTVVGKPAVGEILPLIAPSVREFASSEPIIAQLATTIDSLASYLSSSPSAVPSAKNLISTAQMDLEALGGRLASVKEEERKKLETQLEAKRAEFERELKEKTVKLEEELEKREEGWKSVVEDERAKMVAVFRERLENELEVQSEIINARLKEEVLAQAVELQRSLIRDIKTQVETERGGRLAKLGELETGLKGLEKVTLDNSAILDENVRVHTLWSALRAVQTASETSRQPFDTQLAALTNLTTASRDPSVGPTVLATIPSSTVAGGIESTSDLTYWFIHRVAPRIRSVAFVPEAADAGLLAHLTSFVLSPLLFRKSGNVEGNDVGAVLARAEDRLARNDLDGAAREVNSLKGWPATLAQDWLREARKRLEVEQALEVIATEAKVASLVVVN
ncbi:mitochondrial protein [Phaffia rhodozyma]|uniref:MICOS complex subunit MIC60 n=1 Tax=Phaffia rhodozyma TaxID=264483 RepID=A0A0F7SIR0_PHARH|nr:mitochondrial protein [Phaffia rhodozyma]